MTTCEMFQVPWCFTGSLSSRTLISLSIKRPQALAPPARRSAGHKLLGAQWA